MTEVLFSIDRDPEGSLDEFADAVRLSLNSKGSKPTAKINEVVKEISRGITHWHSRRVQEDLL